MRRGNCYAAAEALFHIMGGKAAGWKPMRVALKHYRTTRGPRPAQNQETHWFLRHSSGLIVDPSKRQFTRNGWWAPPDYTKAVGCGFLTKRPSKKARRLMRQLTWQGGAK